MSHDPYNRPMSSTDPILAELDKCRVANAGKTQGQDWDPFRDLVAREIPCAAHRLAVKTAPQNADNFSVRLNELHARTEVHFAVMICGDLTSVNVLSKKIQDARDIVARRDLEGVLIFGADAVGAFVPVALVGLEHSPVMNLGHRWSQMVMEVVPDPSSMRDLIAQVARFQPKWSARASAPEMQSRAQALRDLAIQVQCRTSRAGGGVIDTVPHFGKGNAIRVPYVRVFDPKHSPDPRTGVYLCIFISADGQAVHLSLQIGATSWNAANGRWVNKSADVLASESEKLFDKLRSVPTAQSILSVRSAGRSLDLGGSVSDIGPRLSVFAHSNVASTVFAAGSLPSESELREAIWEFLHLAELLNQTTNSSPATISMPDGSADRVARGIHWPTERVDEVLESLTDGSPQVVLAGPPGTGKTYVSRWLASHVLGVPGDLDNERISFVQFHPTYGYEDFVEGLRPVPSGGFVAFETVPGPIVKLARAIEEDGLPRVLIIDEMNRANVARVFGELMYLLEYRDSRIGLMLHEEFELPRELYIIATMNTADKSTRVMDWALRRRFDFFALEPDVNVLKSHYESGVSTNHLGDELYDGFVKLNQALAEDLDRHRMIGHSYFMGDEFSVETLRSRWRRQIGPLLEEYFFERQMTGASYSIERFWPSAKS